MERIDCRKCDSLLRKLIRVCNGAHMNRLEILATLNVMYAVYIQAEHDTLEGALAEWEANKSGVNEAIIDNFGI